MLTVNAERQPTTGEGIEALVAERPSGVFSRQLFLGEALDTEHIDAGYDAGVLTLRIPVAEHAKPRKIQIGAGSGASRSLGDPVSGPVGALAAGRDGRRGPRAPTGSR